MADGGKEMKRSEKVLYAGLAITVLGGLTFPFFVFVGLAVAAAGAWAADRNPKEGA